MTKTITNLNRTSPVWTHDTDDSRYRGSFVSINEDRPNDSEILDVYLGDNLSTIIMRFSSDGPDYHAFPRKTVERLAELAQTQAADFSDWTEALRLVQTSKFITGPRHNGERGPDEDENSLFLVKRWYRWDGDNNGGWARTVHFLEANAGISDPEEVKRYVHIHFPETYCRHAHDCCGHYYSRRAKITHLPNGLWMVTQYHSQNV